jgi:hypothetical protein
VTDRTAQSTISRWVIAGAIFGGVCNLSCVILEIYQDYCSQHILPDWDCLQRIESDGLQFVLPTAIALASSLVLFALHRLWPVVFIYTAMLFVILVWRVECPHEYYALRKYDEPGLAHLFLGMISTVVVLVWVMFRLVVFMRRMLKSRSEGKP